MNEKEGALQYMKLIYKGLFRLPQLTGRKSTFAYGGDHIAIRNTASGKGNLLVSGHEYDQLVTAVTIPQITNTRNINKAKVAPLFREFVDITGGYKDKYGPDIRLGGMIVHHRRLHWSLVKYYNVDGEKIPCVGESSTNLSQLVAEPPKTVRNIHPHKMSGYFIEHPSHGLLVGRTNRPGYGNRELASEGPAAFRLWDGKEFFFFVGGEHNPPWKGADMITGGFVAEDGVFHFIARLGEHPEDYYGEASNFPGPGKPCSDDKGYHAPPYRIYLMSYTSKTSARFTDLTQYFLKECCELGGVTFDRETKTLYIAEKFADLTNEFEPIPVIHVFGVS